MYTLNHKSVISFLVLYEFSTKQNKNEVLELFFYVNGIAEFSRCLHFGNKHLGMLYDILPRLGQANQETQENETMKQSITFTLRCKIKFTSDLNNYCRFKNKI